MKILIGYDGSECSGAALEDLTRAGLPPGGTEALILTVMETWLPKDFDENSFEDVPGLADSEAFTKMREAALEKISAGEKLAEEAARRVGEMFPAWRVTKKTLGGFPEWGIIEEAGEYKPDLIILGSHGRGNIGRFILGSVSLKVLSQAACSVRIVRKPETRRPDDDSPLRIVVAVDGSADSEKALAAVQNRSWPPETSVRLVTAVETMPFSILLGEMPRAAGLRESAAVKLKEKRLHASSAVEFGRARDVIVGEAEKWGADAIFIGAKGHGLTDRLLLGSVSHAVAARAHCPVEVVR